MFDFLNKPVSYKLEVFYREHYAHVHDQKYYRVRLKYKHIPFYIKLDKDAKHSFFKQLFSFNSTRWEGRLTAAQYIHTDVKKWFQDPPPKEQSPKNVYDF